MARGRGWLLRHGREPRAIVLLAAVAAADSVVPMIPAEVLALTLMILQPRRLGLLAAVFALAAAASAGLLAMLVAGVAQAASVSGWLASERLGPGWSQAVSLVQAWGAPVLALAAVFPDSPRTSVAVAALASLPPLTIASMILVGKLVLYGLMAWIVGRTPKRLSPRARVRWPAHRPVGRHLRRFLALRRWLAAHAAREGVL